MTYHELTQVMQSKTLIAHIKFTLGTLKPKPNVSEQDVLQHVIQCLIEALQSGTVVRKPVAWGRLVATRYIYKQYKLCKLSILVESDQLEYYRNINFPNHSSGFDIIDRTHLYDQLARLKDSERQIIEWRFFDNLSWSEIAVNLSTPTKIVTEQSARQRGTRAMKSLRSLYLA